MRECTPAVPSLRAPPRSLLRGAGFVSSCTTRDNRKYGRVALTLNVEIAVKDGVFAG